MGLLGDSWDDPRTMATLQLAAGLLGGGGFGKAASRGLSGYQQTMAAAQQEAMEKQKLAMAEKSQAAQMQMSQLQIAEMQRQAQERERQQQFLQGLQSPQTVAAGQALAGGGEPIVGNAAAMPKVDPMQEMMFNAVKAGVMPLPTYLQSLNKDNAPIKLGKDDRLLEPGTNRVLVDAMPDPAKMPAAIQEYEYAKRQGYPGSFQQFVIDQKKAGATNVSVSQQVETEFRKAQGKDFSETMTTLNKAGFNAPSQIRKLERMDQLLSGVDGGKLAPTGLELASALNSMGIKVDAKLGNKEAAEALARDMAGGLRQPGTGPMTDKDFDNFLTQIPSLSKSAEGRKQITSTMKAALARDVQLSKMARDYVAKKGQLDNGFMDEAAEFVARNPVVNMPAGWTPLQGAPGVSIRKN